MLWGTDALVGVAVADGADAPRAGDVQAWDLALPAVRHGACALR